MCGRAAKAPDCKSGGRNRPSWVRVLPHAPTILRKGSLTGKAVVLKTTALALAGSSPVPSANFTDL